MKFGTKNVEIKVSPYIGWGTKEVRITDISIKAAQTGAKRVMFHFETRPVTTNGFTPDADATGGGQIGKASFSGWMNESKPSYDKMVETFNRKVNDVATVIGKSEELDAIEASTLEEFVAKITPVLKGEFAHYIFAAEEYAGKDKNGEPKTKFVLSIPDFKFVSAEDNLEFNKENKYHYRKLEVVDTPGFDTESTSSESDW